MPRAKRPSDELHNARKRVTRIANNLERSGNIQAASNLRSLVEQSKGKGASVDLNQLLRAEAANRPAQQAARQVRESVPQPARTPRPKRASDEVYNARRRLRRQAERIERESAQATGSAKEIALGFAKYLRQQAKATGKLTKEQRKAALDRLNNIREQTKGVTYDPFRVRRRNAILMQQVNAAGTEGAESSISERKKDVFWAATKGLWPKGSNVPRNERYDMILSHFYTDNTSDAQEFRAWLEKKKGTNAQESFGDLQLVYEYITEELNDPARYDDPELPYAVVMDLIRTAM